MVFMARTEANGSLPSLCDCGDGEFDTENRQFFRPFMILELKV